MKNKAKTGAARSGEINPWKLRHTHRLGFEARVKVVFPAGPKGGPGIGVIFRGQNPSHFKGFPLFSYISPNCLGPESGLNIGPAFGFIFRVHHCLFIVFFWGGSVPTGWVRWKRVGNGTITLYAVVLWGKPRSILMLTRRT